MVSSISPVAIRMTWTALPITSAGLRSPREPLGVRKARLGGAAKRLSWSAPFDVADEGHAVDFCHRDSHRFNEVIALDPHINPSNITRPFGWPILVSKLLIEANAHGFTVRISSEHRVEVIAQLFGGQLLPQWGGKERLRSEEVTVDKCRREGNRDFAVRRQVLHGRTMPWSQGRFHARPTNRTESN